MKFGMSEECEILVAPVFEYVLFFAVRAIEFHFKVLAKAILSFVRPTLCERKLHAKGNADTCLALTTP